VKYCGGADAAGVSAYSAGGCTDAIATTTGVSKLTPTAGNGSGSGGSAPTPTPTKNAAVAGMAPVVEVLIAAVVAVAHL
jgi:hypothetical protein